MAENSEYSFPFDSDDVNGEPDRKYLADDFAEYFRAFITSGTFMKTSSNLQIVANGDMTVTLRPGQMMIDGYRYRNKADILVPLSPADGVMNRIDRISVTWSAWDRDIHYTLQKGSPAYKPVPPVCRRNAEYKDYVLADIYVAAGAISIRQADITDRRLDGEVCGLAMPFNEIDTESLYAQLHDFYEEFVDKSNTSHEEFCQMAQKAYDDFHTDITKFYTDLSGQAQEAHNQFHADIEEYIYALRAKGDNDLATITKQLIDFRNENEAEFLAWVQQMKDILGEEVPGESLLNLKELKEDLEEIQTMLLSGSVMARILTDSGNHIVDSMGRPLLSSRPICKCN